ncbi:uncharacterized protein BX664DRAFT_387744 [Halteromyces radiatus]|uniref:uncharacterized protein n=1 Tax=Halteromyces radiatus TaxID=101107 RepID=UPI002220317A|nr:uncharacterized protein BX664DRAFT_387744 [Halteromyces radiatus]KAI8085110.1 hypothetical protein BX664DRAFT_387744 [Halteromyces radiatus]
MSSPFENNSNNNNNNNVFSFSSPQGILRDHLRNSLLAYQSRTMLGRNRSTGIFGRPRSRPRPKDVMSLLETYTHGPPFYPSYLNDTIYALLVEQQYNHYRQKYDTVNAKAPNHTKNNRIPIKSSSATNSSLSHTTTMTNLRQNPSTSLLSSADIDEPVDKIRTTYDSSLANDKNLSADRNNPISPNSLETGSWRRDSFLNRLEMQDLRLPTAWSSADRGDFLDLGQDDMEVSYKGTGKEETETSSVRSNYSAKPQCGLFYFEVQILAGDEDSDGHVVVGFCGEYSRLDRLPGTDGHSWGYHGENGYLYGGPTASTNIHGQHHSTSSNTKYGPSFGIGDTIGCGIDFRDNTAFYTRNGVHLGTAFRDIKGKLFYPMIGFKTPGDKVIANFGQLPCFAFDIHQYRKDEANRMLQQVLSSSSLPYSNDTVSSQQEEEPVLKKRITLMDQLVVDYLNHGGYIDTFLTMKKEMKKEIDTQTEQEEYSRAKIRHDICMALRHGEIDKVFSQCQQHYPKMLDHYPKLLFRLRCQKFITMVESVNSQQQQRKSPTSHTGDKRRRSIAEIEEDDDDDDLMYHWRDLQTVMDFGQFLQEIYGATNKDVTSNRMKDMEDDDKKEDVMMDLTGIDVKYELTATFSILAYINTSDYPNAYLSGPRWRDNIASDLNAAMLATEGDHPMSSLETLYRQTNVAIHELVLNGDGQASLLPSLDNIL